MTELGGAAALEPIGPSSNKRRDCRGSVAALVQSGRWVELDRAVAFTRVRPETGPGLTVEAGDDAMKYMISWWELPQGSAIEKVQPLSTTHPTDARA